MTHKIFHLRDDWIESKLKSKTRESMVAVSIVIALGALGALGMVVWWFADSWIPLAICALGLGFCVRLIAHIPKRRKIFSALRLTASETGLSVSQPGEQGEVLYPWATLTYRINTAKVDGAESITIENQDGQGRVELGLENMGELISLLEDR
jgi:hypothetical protein